MKTMLLAFCAVIGIAVIAYFGLHAVGFGAAESTASTAVRLPD
ncbi:hypothetical protein CLV80_10162 [Yoonia maritima]|uniref:Uncharacterized protein n=1 Tax=Yoonia maritima TaxID=1435347 RepID=A0A2T0W4B0_9RHOB|nr:hypothetical protein [Yoonia maritima]PRY80211.1 hypothetical protein CLV80_10162 [Yoonia maritima]